MKRWGFQEETRFDERELKIDLGRGNFIFVGSSCDMFANDVPDDWIISTLNRLNEFDNKYLVQSKNPSRFQIFQGMMKPAKYTICTTIESNRFYPEVMRNSPTPQDRMYWMNLIPRAYKKMVTIEPILDFNLKDLSYLILCCGPDQVNIGADSGNNHLPEPSPDKVRNLIDVLSRHTTVHQKPNLARLLKE
jgi:hypothetical protein